MLTPFVNVNALAQARPRGDRPSLLASKPRDFARMDLASQINSGDVFPDFCAILE